MNNTEILKLLEELAIKLGVEIHYVKLMPKYSAGGLCKHDGKLELFIDSKLKLEDTIELLVQELRKLDVSSLFIPPLVRKYFTEIEE